MLYLTHFERDKGDGRRREHEAGRTLLKLAVKEEYGFLSLPDIERGEHGKPYFPDYSRIYFNISHSAGMAVCALAESEIGVDIEHVRRVGAGLPGRVLSETEKDWLAAQTDREEAFIRLWTLKESYIKATGDGLAAELSAVEFRLPDAPGGEIWCSDEDYSFYQKKLGETMYLSLCIKACIVPASMRKLHIIF